MLDWIPTTHKQVIYVLSAFLQDQAVWFGGKDILNVKSNNGIKAFTSITTVMSQIAEYPFTQLSTNDPQVVYNSLHNPDGTVSLTLGRFLWWWATWITETMITFYIGFEDTSFLGLTGKMHIPLGKLLTNPLAVIFFLINRTKL